MFFFEKKNQKTFVNSESGCSRGAKKNEQKFLILFSKRSTLLDTSDRHQA